MLLQLTILISSNEKDYFAWLPSFIIGVDAFPNSLSMNLK
jgi:hypothetical protein